jgi:hypothetical protein
MKVRRYALEPGGPERLEVRSKGAYKKVTLLFDGQVVVEDATAKDLQAGLHWTLPDGSRLSAKRVTNYITGYELQLFRDGLPVQGSGADPMSRVKQGAYALAVVAGLTVAVSALALTGAIESFAAASGFGLGTLVEGLIIAVLAYGTYRRFQVAVILGSLILAAEALMRLLSTPPRSPLVLLVLLAFTVRAWLAMRTLKKSEAAEQALRLT